MYCLFVVPNLLTIQAEWRRLQEEIFFKKYCKIYFISLKIKFILANYWIHATLDVHVLYMSRFIIINFNLNIDIKFKN
jgi:hypothetical protein